MLPEAEAIERVLATVEPEARRHHSWVAGRVDDLGWWVAGPTGRGAPMYVITDDGRVECVNRAWIGAQEVLTIMLGRHLKADGTTTRPVTTRDMAWLVFKAAFFVRGVEPGRGWRDESVAGLGWAFRNGGGRGRLHFVVATNGRVAPYDPKRVSAAEALTALLGPSSTSEG